MGLEGGVEGWGGDEMGLQGWVERWGGDEIEGLGGRDGITRMG